MDEHHHANISHFLLLVMLCCSIVGMNVMYVFCVVLLFCMFEW